MSAPPESVGGIYLQAMPYSIARRADILRIGSILGGDAPHASSSVRAKVVFRCAYSMLIFQAVFFDLAT